ncbi:MAG TPA: hypothetical protein VJR29_03035 [bacterium]|nr:hypothetical protein [bacterium]
MFPRVLGRILGRIASATCEGFHQFQQSARNVLSQSPSDLIEGAFRRGLTDAALMLIAPPAARPLVAAFRAWEFINSRNLSENRVSETAEPATSSMKGSLECYLQAMSLENSYLISPVGTLPYEECLH